MIENLSHYQVFFGENEAGKSTIMAFIHSVLFGFPTKQQNELRYEPKQHSKYGGKIKIHHEQQGYAVIERVKGKATGDVTVIMDNGVTGGEELLSELLDHLDKGLFQAIFSFNLHGLQNIQHMKGEELGKYLFSAGALGTEKLVKAETILQKELDGRFKPGGKKPIINEKLRNLHDLQKELKQAAARNKQYEDMVRLDERLRREIELTNETLIRVQKTKEKWLEWKKVEEIVKAEKRVEIELENLGKIESFPIRGVDRLEKLKELIHPCNAKLSTIGNRIETVTNELEAAKPDYSFLKREPELLTLFDQVPIMEQLQFDKQQVELNLLKNEQELSQIREKLHLTLPEQEILQINTNIYIKKQVETVSDKNKNLVQIKSKLETEYEEEKQALEELEKELHQLEKLCLPEQEKERLEQQLQENQDKKSIEAEITNTKDKIDFYQGAAKRESSANARQKWQYIMAEALVIGLALYGFFTDQVILLILGLAGIVIVIFFLIENIRKGKAIKDITTLKALKETEQTLLQKLQSANIVEIKNIEERLQNNQQIEEKLNLVMVRKSHQQAQFDKVITKFEQWEYEFRKNHNQFLVLSKELKIPEKMPAIFLRDAFQYIEQAKSLIREKQYLLQRLETVDKEREIIENSIKTLAKHYLPETAGSTQQLAYLLRTKLKSEQEKQVSCREKKRQLADLELEWKQTKLELDKLQDDYQELLAAANAKTEQQFYELGEKAGKRALLQERLAGLRTQLQYSILSEQEREAYLSMQIPNEAGQEYDQSINALRKDIKTLQEKLATNKVEMQVLEEGGVYSTILHQFKQKKYEFEEEVKQWAVYSYAQDLLKKTIESYKNIYLPRVLKQAQEYLAFLTKGRYRRLLLHPSGSGFLVERKDGTVFAANEVSQATTEQIYVSMRLSLAITLYEQYPLPIIIDDSFVNFDSERAKRMIGLLNTLERNQILFFTCHEHYLPLFTEESILRLEKGTVQISS